MGDANLPRSDNDLRAAILDGLAAAAELESRFRQPLERLLIGMCDRGDGRSQEKAVEIASQVVADCFVKSPSLLERWKGGDNLEAFLRTTASHRLKSWWRSRDHALTEVNSDSTVIARAAGAPPRLDEESLRLATESLIAGVKAAEEKCPEGVVFMRLKGLHGVDQRTISTCWGHHEAQTSRRIREAMELIRTAAAKKAKELHFELSMDALQEALQQQPGVLLGGGASATLPGSEELLRSVARGGAAEKARAAAVSAMCGNASSLAHFAKLLNRGSQGEIVVVSDAGLTGVGTRLDECLRRTLSQMQAAEVPGLFTPLMEACFSDMLAHVAADGGTLWWLCPEREALEAVYNPREPEIIGKRQPLVSGIVSLVLGTGEPQLVSAATEHARHSPAIDIALGKITRSMIAVPFTIRACSCGVLTAVRLARETPFTKEDAGIIAHHGGILGELLEARIEKLILS